MNRQLIFCLLLFLNLNLIGQKMNNPFEVLRGEREVIFGLDNRRTHIHGDRAVIYGVYSGIGFSEKSLRLKLSLSGSPFEIGRKVDNAGNIKLNRFFFFSVGEEFDFYKYNHLTLSTYFQLGMGVNYFTEIEHQSGIEISSGKNRIIPLELGLQSGYSLLTWLSIKIGGGWRFDLPQNKSGLSGYYAKFGLQFNPSDFLKAYNKWKFRKITFR